MNKFLNLVTIVVFNSKPPGCKWKSGDLVRFDFCIENIGEVPVSEIYISLGEKVTERITLGPKDKSTLSIPYPLTAVDEEKAIIHNIPRLHASLPSGGTIMESFTGIYELS